MVDKFGGDQSRHIGVPPDRVHWEQHGLTSLVFLPKMYTLNLILRKHQPNSNWDILQNNLPAILKSFEVTKIKTLKNSTRMEETRQLNGIRESLCYEGHY